MNKFFGVEYGVNNELKIWTGHRYNTNPRKMLISTSSMKVNEFKIGRPKLISTMSAGVELNRNYIRLEKANNKAIFLKIDFNMFFAESIWSYRDKLSATAIFSYNSLLCSKHAVSIKKNIKNTIILNFCIIIKFYVANVQKIL